MANNCAAMIWCCLLSSNDINLASPWDECLQMASHIYEDKNKTWKKSWLFFNMRDAKFQMKVYEGLKNSCILRVVFSNTILKVEEISFHSLWIFSLPRGPGILSLLIEQNQQK